MIVTRYTLIAVCLIANFLTFKAPAKQDQNTGLPGQCEELIMYSHHPDLSQLEQCISELESSGNYHLSKPWILLIGKARFDFYRFNFQKSMSLYEDVRAYLLHMPPQDQSCYYVLYSRALNLSGEIRQAKKIAREGVRAALRNSDSTRLSELYSNLAIAFSRASDLDSGIYYLGYAREIAKITKDEYAEAVVNLNTGNIYLNMNLLDKAKSHYQKTYDIAIKKDYPELQQKALNNLASALYTQRKHDSSIAIGKRLQKLLQDPESNEIKDTKAYANNLLLLGTNYNYLNKPGKAEAYLLKALSYLKPANKATLYNAYFSLSDFYHNYKDFDKTILYADKVLEIREETGMGDGIGFLYNYLATAYEGKGNYKKANHYRKLQREYEIKTYNQTNVLSLEEAVLNSNHLKKELITTKGRLSFLEKNKKNLIAGLICALLLLILIFYAYHRSSIFNKSLLLKNKEKEKHILEQENKLKDQAKRLVELEADNEIPLVLPNGKCIQAGEILYVKSEGHYLSVKTTGNSRHVFRSSLAKIQKQLPANLFSRVHHSYIVNLIHISSTRYRELILSNDEIIKIGPTFADQFKKAFQAISE